MRRCILVCVLWLGASCGTAVVAADEEPKVTLSAEADGGHVVRGTNVGLEVFATISRGWHINSNRPNNNFSVATVLSLSVPKGVKVDAIRYPPPDKRTFAFAPGTELLVFEGKVGMTTAINVPADFAAKTIPIELILRYQACNDTSCKRPVTDRTTIELPVVDRPAGADGGAGGATADPAPVHSSGGADVERWLGEYGLLVTLAAVFLLGLGLNLTPCVYPLISVTIAYFGGQARSRRTVGLLAAVYVVGIALSFSVLGVAAALSGGLFGAALQQPVVLIAIAGLMVVLALGSFGVYQLQPPAALMRWAGHAGSGVAGALFMGLTMGIVAAPCVGPIVVGLLLFVGSRQEPWLGFLLFFVLALGMGAPYLALATMAGSLQRLPRSGEWLLWTERLFGCILLCLAAYYVAPLFPDAIAHWLLPAAIALSGIYLGFLEPAGRSLRLFPLIKATVGVLMLAAALWFAQPGATEQAIAWEPFDRFAAAGAAASGEKPLLIDFGAEWCIPCREMEHTTYLDPSVVREAERFRMVKADVTNEDESTTEVVERYEVKGVPTVLLFSPAGNETHRMVGYVGPDELATAMKAVR